MILQSYLLSIPLSKYTSKIERKQVVVFTIYRCFIFHALLKVNSKYTLRGIPYASGTKIENAYFNVIISKHPF